MYLGVVVALDLEGEGRVEGYVVLGAGLDVDLLDQTRARHHLIPVHHVHQGLLQGNLTDAAAIRRLGHWKNQACWLLKSKLPLFCFRMGAAHSCARGTLVEKLLRLFSRPILGLT